MLAIPAENAYISSEESMAASFGSTSTGCRPVRAVLSVSLVTMLVALAAGVKALDPLLLLVSSLAAMLTSLLVSSSCSVGDWAFKSAASSPFAAGCDWSHQRRGYRKACWEESETAMCDLTMALSSWCCFGPSGSPVMSMPLVFDARIILMQMCVTCRAGRRL